MSSKQTKTTDTTTNPWSPAQPALTTALAGAQNAYNSTYNGSSVASKDPLVTQGGNQIVNTADQGVTSGLAGQAGSNLSTILGQMGLSAPQLAAMGGMGGALGSFADTNASVEAGLTPYASGQMLGANNGLVRASIGNAMQDAADTVNSQFSGAGRYGSGAQTKVLADRLGNIATDAYRQQANTDQQTQLSALGQLGNANSSGLSGMLSGLGGIAGLGQTGVTNTGNAISSLGTRRREQSDEDWRAQSGLFTTGTRRGQSGPVDEGQQPCERRRLDRLPWRAKHVDIDCERRQQHAVGHSGRAWWPRQSVWSTCGRKERGLKHRGSFLVMNRMNLSRRDGRAKALQKMEVMRCAVSNAGLLAADIERRLDDPATTFQALDIALECLREETRHAQSALRGARQIVGAEPDAFSSRIIARLKLRTWAARRATRLFFRSLTARA